MENGSRLVKAVKYLDEAAEVIAASKVFNRLLHAALFGGAFYVSIHPELAYLAPLFQVTGQYVSAVK